MEKRQKRPVHIRFESRQEAIDLYIRIELLYFLKKLLHTHPNRIV